GGAQDEGASGDPEHGCDGRCGKQTRNGLAPAVGSENPGRVGACSEKGGVSERNDARIAEDKVDRECKNDRRKNLCAQRQIVRKYEIRGGGSQPWKSLQHTQTMPAREGVKH